MKARRGYQWFLRYVQLTRDHSSGEALQVSRTVCVANRSDGRAQKRQLLAGLALGIVKAEIVRCVGGNLQAPDVVR